MRTDYSNKGNVQCEESYYGIEEYQSKWDRWMPIGEGYHCDALSNTAHNEYSASGKCWQRYGHHGMINKNKCIEYCNELKRLLPVGLIKDNIGEVTDFRVVKWEIKYRKEVL